MKWLCALFLSCVFIRALEPVEADDFFMYLALGRRLIQNGEFGVLDPYVFTIPDFHWHVWHEWASYLLYYGLHSLGGLKLTILWKASMVTAEAALVWRAAARHGMRYIFLLALGAATFFMASARCFGDRSSFISDLLLTAMLVHLTNPRQRTPGLWDIIGWGALFALWIQFHPGFVIGWFFLGLFVAVHFRSWSAHQRRQWVLVFAACVIAPVLNPLGPAGVLYPVKTMLAPEFNIFRTINSEWMPTWPHYLLNLPYKIALVVWSLFALGATFSVRRHDHWFKFLAAIVLVYLGWSAIRFLAFTGFGLGVLISTSLGEQRPIFDQDPRYFRRLLIALCAGYLVFTLAQPNYGPRALIEGDGLNPLVAIKAVKQFHQLPPGNIFNEYNAGGLLAWELDGRMKIAGHGHLDRADLVLQNYMRFSYSQEDWKRIVIGGNVRYFLVYLTSLASSPQAGWVMELMRNWQVIYRDEVAVIFTPRGAPSESPPAR